MIQIPNKMLACEPFESLAIQTQGKTFVTAKQKGSLYPTKVVFGPALSFSGEGYIQALPGDTVFIRGNDQTNVWAREVFEIEGKKFILVPMANIVAVNSSMYFGMDARTPVFPGVPAESAYYMGATEVSCSDPVTKP